MSEPTTNTKDNHEDSVAPERQNSEASPTSINQESSVAKVEEIKEDLEEELLEADPEFFQGIPEERKQILLTRMVSMKIESSHHRGPIPSPENLERYNKIIPEGANRFMIMAENQQNHRMMMENKVVERQLNQSFIGQLFGLIIGLAAIGCSTACILNGHEWPGAIFGVAGLTGLVSVFVIGRQKQRENLKKKNPD